MKSRALSNYACKVTMAVTGLLFAGFVLAHMIGNLKVYQGADAFNAYAAWLREVGYPLLPREGVLWALRVVLGLALVAHIECGIALWLRGRAARGSFRRRGRSPKAWAATLMVPSGLLLLAFIIVHLLDLTLGTLGAPAFRHPDASGFHAYDNLVASFQRPGYAVFYLVVMLVLALHLAQGLWSALHDLGGTAGRLRRVWVAVAGVAVIAITVVNSSIPLAVMMGWLT